MAPSPPSVIRVTHVITTLETGGAERMLELVLAHSDGTQLRPSVVSLADVGAVGRRIADSGVPVQGLGIRRGLDVPTAVLRLARHLRASKPHVVQTWMYHADLFGGLAARVAGVPAVAWGLHATNLRPGAIKRSTLMVVRVNARLVTWLPDAVVCSSKATRRTHVQQGYPPDKMLIIGNGVPVDDVDEPGGLRFRAELGIAPDTPLVGRVGRYHPQKDFRTFVAAAARVAEAVPHVRFVLCGRGVTTLNDELCGWIRDTGHVDRFHLVGERSDISAVHAALDVAVSSSAFGESLPLVLGEAMVQQVPVVTTNVGDCAELVGETGRVVRPEDPAAMADAITHLLALTARERRSLGVAARRRVADRFSIDRAVAAYERLHVGLATRSGVR